MRTDLREMKAGKTHQAAIPVHANLLRQIKSERDGRSQNAFNNAMKQILNESSVSVQANLLQQVKSQRDGRSQNVPTEDSEVHHG